MLSIENADVLGNFASSGGGGVIPTNSVILDYNAEEVADKVFNDYTSAREYVNDQRPDERNRWTIFLNGTAKESGGEDAKVYLDPYVNIIGNYRNSKITELESAIDAPSNVGNSIIKGCEINSILEINDYYYFFEDCSIALDESEQIDNGYFYFKRCLMVSGDFGFTNTPSLVIVDDCVMGNEGGCHFEENSLYAYNTDFTLGKYHLYGGYFERCDVTLTDFVLFDREIAGGTYILENCYIGGGALGEYEFIITLTQCYGSETGIDGTLASSSVVTTRNCTDIIVTAVDTWTNTGAIYDDDGVGTLTNTQEAIKKFPVFTDDVSNPPTKSELDSAIGEPATVGAGYKAIVDDNGAGANVYLVVSDGTNWWHQALTKSI
jgi:hypothetical protein